MDKQKHPKGNLKKRLGQHIGATKADKKQGAKKD